MHLNELEFHILNALADGSEPFSMIYNEIVAVRSDSHLNWDKWAICKALCDLISRGFVRLVDSNELLTPLTISEHYADIEKELFEGKFPFYFSQGEFFFEMTDAGRKEWDKEEYRIFYKERNREIGSIK